MQTFFTWEHSTSNNEGSIRKITDIIIQMRKDMGNPKTMVTSIEFLHSIVRNDQEYDKLWVEGII